MASILKERARKPIMEGAGCYASETWKDNSPFFRITLFDRSLPHYDVELSRAEMLGIVAEWLKIEANYAKTREKKAEKQAA